MKYESHCSAYQYGMIRIYIMPAMTLFSFKIPLVNCRLVKPYGDISSFFEAPRIGTPIPNAALFFKPTRCFSAFHFCDTHRGPPYIEISYRASFLLRVYFSYLHLAQQRLISQQSTLTNPEKQINEKNY